MSKLSPSATRLPALEMLRGAASVAVVFHHIAQQQYGNALAAYAMGRLFLWLGGWGVVVFFVLSGFCIHRSVLQDGTPGPIQPAWRTYFIRRARRILPGYLVTLAVSLILGSFGDSNLITKGRWVDIWTHLTLTSGFSHDTALRVNSVLWTVVVEMHFYLIYPLFVCGRNRIGIMRLTGLLLAVSCCIKLGGRWWFDEAERWTWHHSFLNLWWIWSLGALLAEVHAGIPARIPRPGLIDHPLLASVIVIGSLGVGCIDARDAPLMWHVFESYGLPLLASMVVAVAVFSPVATFQSGVLQHLGTVSYSMYLLHPIALWMAVQAMPSAGSFAATTVMLILSWLLAVAGYKALEQPFLARRSALIVV